MPKLILCNEAGCNALSDERYCPKHRRPKEKKNWREAKTKPFANAVRYNTELYKTPRWKALRTECFERDDYRCTQCGMQFAEGLEAHHIIRPMGDENLFFSLNNLRCVCKACHQTITQKQTKGE